MPARTGALLILDMVSEFRFPQWQATLREARRIAPAIASLRDRARRAGMPVIYVNDTGHDWEADQSAFVKRCRAAGARGREVTERIAPGAGDYFLFKPRHSGFYSTPLPALLQMKAIDQLILTGLTSHQCVLFTAMDAYVRDFGLIVPPDCIGAPTRVQTRHALFILKEALRARTPLSGSLKLGHQPRRDQAL